MPRANRYFLPDHIWHITHRCHKKSFLLKFALDRRAYVRWLFEAKRRFGLQVLDYAVTSNHIHLLVRDGAESVIAQSMQLAAGRTGQEYNQRKQRQGAFWEDRYHATAVECGDHLRRCLVYIDLNMVRAGVVRHPAEWAHGGYREIQNPPERYALIDLPVVSALCGFARVDDFQRAHRAWVEEALSSARQARDARWSEAIAVGSQGFVERVQGELGIRAKHRAVEAAQGVCALREPREAYTGLLGTENSVLRPENGMIWTDTYVNS